VDFLEILQQYLFVDADGRCHFRNLWIVLSTQVLEHVSDPRSMFLKSGCSEWIVDLVHMATGYIIPIPRTFGDGPAMG
jgi:hypothetical protein